MPQPSGTQGRVGRGRGHGSGHRAFSTECYDCLWTGQWHSRRGVSWRELDAQWDLPPGPGWQRKTSRLQINEIVELQQQQQLQQQQCIYVFGGHTKFKPWGASSLEKIRLAQMGDILAEVGPTMALGPSALSATTVSGQVSGTLAEA